MRSGEIVVKSPLVMSCYLGDQQATDKAIIELPGRGYGWFRTGVLTRFLCICSLCHLKGISNYLHAYMSAVCEICETYSMSKANPIPQIDTTN